jgi:antitoxin component of MazEF toxin-antitoxin module
MKRKIIKQGLSGLTIYIPKKWANSKNLKGGDEVEIVELDDDLILSSSKKNLKKETEITLEVVAKPYVIAMLNQVYFKDYDVVKIHFTNVELKKIIEEVVEDYYMGFEITKTEKNEIIIESVSEPDLEKQETILKRIFYILEGSMESMVESGDDIEKNHEKILRYLNFCKRSLVRKGTIHKSLSYWSLFSKLQNLSYAILEYSKEKPKKENLKKIKELFSNIYTSFYKKDLENLHKNTYATYNLRLKLLEGKQSPHLIYITQIIRLFNEPMTSIILEN